MCGRNFNSQISRPYDHIIMDCGSGNTRRFIVISSIANALESKQKRLVSALPRLHASTCCDYISAFYQKGRVKPLEVVENDSEGNLIRFFNNLTTENQPDQKVAEEFICALRSMKIDVKDVNEVRYVKLCQMSGKMNQVCQWMFALKI